MSPARPYALGAVSHEVLHTLDTGAAAPVAKAIGVYLGFSHHKTCEILRTLMRRGMISRVLSKYQLSARGREALRRKAARGYTPGVTGAPNLRATKAWEVFNAG